MTEEEKTLPIPQEPEKPGQEGGLTPDGKVAITTPLTGEVMEGLTQEGRITLNGIESNAKPLRAFYKAVTTETGEVTQTGVIQFEPHEGLIFWLNFLFLRLKPEEVKTRDELLEIINYLRDHLSSIEIKKDEKGIITGLGFGIYGGEEDTPEEVSQKIQEHLQHPIEKMAISNIANGWDLKKEEELRKAQEEAQRAKEEAKEARKELQRKEKELKKKEGKYSKWSMHGIAQQFGDKKQPTLFSNDKIDDKIDEFIKDADLQIENKPESYGMALNQSQSRVYEGILRAFSDTNYSGHELIDKDQYNRNDHPIKKMQKAYSNVNKIPIIRLTQAEIIERAGYDLKKQRHEDKNDVTEAIQFLATKQFCFYWVRLKIDSKGKPIKDKSGNYVKEEVMEVGSLLRIKTVREAGELRYYEIHPSAPVIDQVSAAYGGNYYLLIPINWREEVKKVTGKRASVYTYQFLIWLRVQFEKIRRGKRNKPYTLNKSWEEIAMALKMPESMYKANRKRAHRIIQEAYSVAVALRYLLKVENTGVTDVLYLNERYYPVPGELRS